MLSTSVQADRQGPSITTRSPLSRTFSNKSRNGPTCPPGDWMMRISAKAGVAASSADASIKALRKVTRRMKPPRIRFRRTGRREEVGDASQIQPAPCLPVPPLAAQRRQADARRIEAAIDGQNLSGDVAGSFRAQEVDGFGEFLFQAVAVERDGVVIVGADLPGVHLLRHRGVDRPRCDRVDTDVEGRELDRELLGKV